MLQTCRKDLRIGSAAIGEVGGGQVSVSPVQTTMEGNIGVVRLVRPPVNAVNLELVMAAFEAVEQLRGQVEAVVITGDGPCFCAGVDVKAIPGYTSDERRDMILSINRMIQGLYGFPSPVISAINGHAIGAGLVLALCGDYRIAAQGIRLTLPEALAGIPFPAGPMEVVKGELSAHAARLLTLGRPEVSTLDPVALGVIDEQVVVDAVAPRAMEVARAYARTPARSYQIVKRQLRGPALQRMQRIVDEESDPLLDAWLAQ